VAGVVPEAPGTTLVGLGSAAVTTGSAVATHLAVDTECGVADCDFPVTVAVLPWLGCPPPGAAPLAVGAPLPPLVCVPSPSVPPPPRVGPPPPPPFSEVLAWRIASRTGCTPSAMPASTATPASAVTSRSHLMSHRGKLLRRDRRLQRAPGLGSDSCQAQCPCQVQFRTRSRTPPRTRLVSAPVPGRRRPRVRSCPALTCPPPHQVSRSRIDLSDAIARAVWLFTAPRLIPIALAMSASEKSP
jgi:hypothetical protein